MVERPDVTRRLLFDVTGLLHWYAFLSNPSGIQRVTEKLLSSTVVQENEQVEFVARAIGGDELYKVDGGTLRDLQDPLRRRVAIARLRAYFTMIMRQARPRGPLSVLAIIHVPYFLLGLAPTGAVGRGLVQQAVADRRAAAGSRAGARAAGHVFQPRGFGLAKQLCSVRA
jgi:hypothetical protein